MSSWPWMKGIKEAVADPIPPVNKDDKRPAVKDLIKEHRSKIDEVQNSLKEDPLYDATRHDDLFVLRFLLSHKLSVKKALQAARGSLLFRKDMNFDETDIRGEVISKEKTTCPPLKRYLVYATDDFAIAGVPDVRYGAVIFLRMAGLDQHGVVENVAEEDWLPTFAYINEWSFQWCDYVTRTTGRLTKLIRIADCSGTTLSHINKECSRRDTTGRGEQLAGMECCFSCSYSI